MVEVKNKVCLIVHDGWGLAATPNGKGDAISAGTTTHMDSIASTHSHRALAAHGLSVGLSDGLMGNSEVGHLNIGAGRVVWQDIVKIDVSIKKGAFHKNETILESMGRAKEGNGRLHFLGLVSDGGVHSHIEHLKALLETAKAQGVPHVFVHFFGDGRDTAPKSAVGYAKDLQAFIKELNGDDKENKTSIKIATVAGRYYAMDRDKRWERVSTAVAGLVDGEGEAHDEEELVKAIEARYEKNETDEFLKPIILGGDEGRIKDGDTLFFFNYRSDRMRELTTVFGSSSSPSSSFDGKHDKPSGITSSIPPNLHITTMSRYSPDYTFPVAFPPQGMTNVLAEALASAGVSQAHVAETEKYAHVTFFFNGGVEKQFPHEERFMVPSPKVPTYDHQPEMNVQGVADKVAELVKEGKFEFVMCNFAPPDMVGHTGVYDAAVKAITATDAAVGTVYKACQDAGYILLITADHGNAEQMLNPTTGEPHTAHTTNKVPLIMSGDPKVFRFKEDEKRDGEEEEEGALADVAPTILEIMGIGKPEEMTGRSLLAKNEEETK